MAGCPTGRHVVLDSDPADVAAAMSVECAVSCSADPADPTETTPRRQAPAHRNGASRPVPRPAAADTEQAELRSWMPVDLAAVLDGTYRPPQPSVGARSDGVGLFYPGRVHTVASESEGGKTWLALLAAKQVIEQAHQRTRDGHSSTGRGVVYIDFEDAEGGIVGRLLALGVVPDAIREWFGYLRPVDGIRRAINESDLAEALFEYRPALVILDGVTEAMTLHGLELTSNTDVATFSHLLPRRITLTLPGAAVVMLDHVVKDREGRGRYALGGVHKLNGVDGAAYLLENRAAFGEGVSGRSTVLIAKDRPAQLRKHAVWASGGLHWFADLVLDSEMLAGVPDLSARLVPPEQGSGEPFRPTTVMRKVCDALNRASEPLTVRGIQDRVQGRKDVTSAAVAVLVDEAYIAVEDGPRGARLHRLVTAFTGDAE